VAYILKTSLMNGSPSRIYYETSSEISGEDEYIQLGFDFPTDLPFAYAHKVSLHNFAPPPEIWLMAGARFLQCLPLADQKSIYRPFHPYRPGGTSR
jgi:hypothetical protein